TPPSTPWNTLRPSLSTAIFTCEPAASTTPMNFSVIGGGGGGCGGPLGTTGAEALGAGAVIGRVGGVGETGGGGGACCLDRRRFRSASPGFGRSSSSFPRCTSGASTPAGLGLACVLTGFATLDDDDGGPDVVCTNARYPTPARATSVAARTI